jgi:hypothetical protein
MVLLGLPGDIQHQHEQHDLGRSLVAQAAIDVERLLCRRVRMPVLVVGQEFASRDSLQLVDAIMGFHACVSFFEWRAKRCEGLIGADDAR